MPIMPIMPRHTWTFIRFLPPNGDGYWDLGGHPHCLITAGEPPFMWELVAKDDEPPPPPDIQKKMMPDQWEKIGGGLLYEESNTIYNNRQHWQIHVEGDQAIVDPFGGERK